MSNDFYDDNWDNDPDDEEEKLIEKVRKLDSWTIEKYINVVQQLIRGISSLDNVTRDLIVKVLGDVKEFILEKLGEEVL